MELHLDLPEMRDLVHQVVAEVLSAIDWPTGRLVLDEDEAARACGVGRHVLRDLRLAGKIQARKLGKKVVYTRADLLAALGAVAEDLESVDGLRRIKGGNDARQRSATQP